MTGTADQTNLPKKKGRYATLFSNTLLFGLSTFSSKILVILMMPLYTRVLTPADYGISDLIVSAANLLTPIASIGITESVVRFGMDKAYKKEDVFSTGIMTVIAGFLLLLCAYPLLGMVDNTKEYTALIYLYVLMSCLKSVTAQFVRARGLVRLFAIDGLVSTAMVIIFNILGLLVFKMGITGYVLSTILADGLSTVFLFIVADLHKYLKFKLNKQVAKEMLLFALPMIPNSLCWWITNASDRWMVAAMKGNEMNGLYAVAYKIPTIITAVSMIFTKAWQLSAFNGDSRKKKIAFFSNVFKLYQMFIFVAMSGIIIMIKPFTKILVSAKFYDSWQYVPFLVLAVGFSCYVTFLGTIYMTEKKNVMAMVTTVIGAGLNIVMNFVLIPDYGAGGAAFATFLSFFVVFVIRAIDTRRLMPINMGSIRLVVSTVVVIIQSLIMLSGKSGTFWLEIFCFILILLIQIYAINFDASKAERRREDWEEKHPKEKPLP